MIVIDNDVPFDPAPSKRRRKRQSRIVEALQLFQTVEVGQSFLLPGTTLTRAQYIKAIASRELNRRFRLEAKTIGVRVLRLS